jgi:DNA-binding protein Fis
MDDQKLTMTLAEVERHHILTVLEQMGGNRTKAAAALGISIRTMRNKLKKYKNEDFGEIS